MNVSKLRGAMAENGISGRAMADRLGISDKTFCSKMKGRSSFTIEEVEMMYEQLPSVSRDSFFAIFLPSASQK